MRPGIFSLLISIFFLNAALCYGGGISDQNNRRTGNSQSSKNSLMFIGVSEIQSNRDVAIQAALVDAARKYSFFTAVSGVVISRDIIGSRTQNFRMETDYRLQYDKDLDKFLEQLNFDPVKDIFEYDNAIFVVTRANSSIIMPFSYGHSFGRERPYWIDLPPAEIDGFTVGVGFSSRYSCHSDAVISSYEDAVLAIIENMEISVIGEHINYNNSISGYNNISTSISFARGTLKNFYVIETWTDPVTLSVWTLAVASKG